MPKAKKLRAPALDAAEVHHEPLGQVIEGDSHRGSKYAPNTGRRKQRKDLSTGSGDYLDEKTSRKIIEMSREQQIEEEIDEQRSLYQKNQLQRHQQRAQMNDSDDEEEEEEIEEIVIDEVDDE